MQHSGFIAAPSQEQIRRVQGQLASYRENVKIQVSEDDKKKFYDASKHSGRLNEIKTLFYKVTPPKHHDKIDQIVENEFEIRTALERQLRRESH